MLNENYWISIVGKQSYDDDVGEIKVDTVGSYTKKNGARFISYKEYDEDNPAIAHTAVLKIEDNKMVTMMKGGTLTRLILEKGQRHNCLYDTGAGHLNMGVFTSELKNELTDGGGKLRVNYTLDVNSTLSSQNELCIEVTAYNENMGKELS
ncbi:MAG: DUF1934 domain-containing protein [Oscillospiraceae bacterium]